MSGAQRTAVADPRTRLILPATCLGMLMLGVNGTAIMAALPTMRAELGLDAAQLEWAINAYLIVSAACIIPGGKACDQAGARRVSMTGLALFAIASVIVATAQGPALLLAGRALQGLAAALAVPGTLAAISAASSPERRASAIGAWAGFLMLGFSLGPLIGGALTHYADWRVIFWASGVSMLVAAGGFLVTDSAASSTRRFGWFDWAGFVLLAIFMASLISALNALPTATRAPLDLLGFAALAVAAFAGLLAVERRVHDPLIDLSLFAGAGFVRAIAVGSIAMSCILALLLFYNLDAQSSDGPGTDPGRRRPVAPAAERRAAGLRVLRAVAHPALRPAPRPDQRHAAARRGQRGDCHRDRRKDLDAARRRPVRRGRRPGAALRVGAAPRPRDVAARPRRRGVRHHQRLHLSRWQRRRGRRGGRIRDWRPAGRAGADRGSRPARGVALPRIAGSVMTRGRKCNVPFARNGEIRYRP